jgi:hypothetical protein
MTTTPTTTRQLTIAEADTKKALALKAHKAGDTGLRDSFLKQAADRYRAAGQFGMVRWCARFTG